MADEKKNPWPAIGRILLDIPEKYVSSIAFTVLFVVFVIQIFFRYALNRPLIWPYEISIFAFIWTAVLGACYAKRENAHVVFSLVYDKQRPLVKLLFRLIGNLGLLVAFSVAFLPTADWILFMRIDKSTALQIPFDIAYGPYLVFMLLIIGRVACDLYRDIRTLVKGEVK
jgi:TRAP-type C4-dicarboxylate transport system permease small subunit